MAHFVCSNLEEVTTPGGGMNGAVVIIVIEGGQSGAVTAAEEPASESLKVRDNRSGHPTHELRTDPARGFLAIHASIEG